MTTKIRQKCQLLLILEGNSVTFIRTLKPGVHLRNLGVSVARNVFSHTGGLFLGKTESSGTQFIQQLSHKVPWIYRITLFVNRHKPCGFA